MQFFAENFWLSFGATTKLLSQSFLVLETSNFKNGSAMRKCKETTQRKLKVPWEGLYTLTFYNIAKLKNFCVIFTSKVPWEIRIHYKRCIPELMVFLTCHVKCCVNSTDPKEKNLPKFTHKDLVQLKVKVAIKVLAKEQGNQSIFQDVQETFIKSSVKVRSHPWELLCLTFQ